MQKLCEYELKNLREKDGLISLEIIDQKSDMIRMIMIREDLKESSPSFSFQGVTDSVFDDFVRRNWEKIVGYVNDNL